jgi:hypothetical protein
VTTGTSVGPPTRINIHLSRDGALALYAATERTGVTQTQLANRAFEAYNLLDLARREGLRLFLRDDSGNEREVVLML